MNPDRDKCKQPLSLGELRGCLLFIIVYNSGGSSRNRTADTEIFSLLLYQLS